MNPIDSHAHIYLDQFKEDIAVVVEKSQENQVLTRTTHIFFEPFEINSSVRRIKGLSP